MEEEKQSALHLSIAKWIVDTLADGEDYVSQHAALRVLKPLLEDNIIPLKLKMH